MTALHNLKKPVLGVDLNRDECLVVSKSPGSVVDFKKHFLAARKVLKGKPMAQDPAIDLKKVRNKRGMA